MKNIYILFALLLSLTIQAQIINIPDANFKAKLLQANTTNSIAGTGWDSTNGVATSCVIIDTNSNGEIEQSEALNITQLNLFNSNIGNLIGIEYFINLKQLRCENYNTDGNYNHINALNVTALSNLVALWCSDNQMVSLNVSGLSSLVFIECSNNQLSSLNVAGLNLTKLYCTNNSITSLNLTGMLNLENLFCSYNQLTSLDLSTNIMLYALACDNNQLSHINIKNGINHHYGQIAGWEWSNNPNLNYICADEFEINDLISNFLYLGLTGQNIQVNSYCSFTPGGTYYTIQGSNKLDSNNNGCDMADVVFPYLKFQVTDGTTTSYAIANTTGNYSMSVPAGTHTISPIIENPTYFTVSPPNATVSFPATASPFVQNFCVLPNGTHNDLEIVLHANQARPGFDCTYFITYKNKGNVVQTGTINLAFDDAVLDVNWANPTTTNQTLNNLSWAFTNLQPFETRSIVLSINANSPMETPALNGGDILSFTATVAGDTDENPENNTTVLNQTLVNSYDPNHKTCLEGNTINPTMIGKELHYKIEFENNGTANAQNIVVKDMIDIAKYDINSLIALQGSHPFITKIAPDGKVEFIFENINLPFDNANNDGFVVFKIKTKPTLSLGESVSNTASIYFDYNFPIVTNTETSTFQTLGIEHFFNETKILLYPNPSNGIFNIDLTQETETYNTVSIFNILGEKVVVSTLIAKENNTINLSHLPNGCYFAKLENQTQTVTLKLIKN
jgi:hypothetical protein